MTNKLSIVIPCYNEEDTLAICVERVLEIQGSDMELELIIVDDASSDKSLDIAKKLQEKHKEIIVLQNNNNQGKGAALKKGFKIATGDFVAVQDADLEYDPNDLKKLVKPIINGDADVVFGSRFASGEARRVLYFWHAMGNRFLTFISNMLTDLNLTDMETCYKVFKREVIQAITIEESRFGVEPELVAKIAHMRLKIYEMGISYRGRSYAEGKKIGVRDGFRALYCILHYNVHRAPLPIQFFFYLLIGGVAALVNLACFIVFYGLGGGVATSVILAFIIAAVVNYFLSILLLFRHKARWNTGMELIMFAGIVIVACGFDYLFTAGMIGLGVSAIMAKAVSSILNLFVNFSGRRFVVFPEKSSGSWK